jgi:ABC-type Fe3+/spermidine/putrescine transport system ATPase subunit
MANVRIVELVKRYGSVTALKKVSVEIPNGSLTAILGPSGCGKTTLLRCIAGLLIPDEGRIFIGDKDVTRTEPYRRNLGMVFQRPSMFPHMNVYQNIAWGLSLRGWPKSRIAERVAEMLRLVRLDGMEKRGYNQLSGGQAQRVVIARALAPQPDLLLLDEPLSALDAKLRGELLHEIADIHLQTGCTTLLVTHDQGEALTVADNLLLMNAGEIVQEGAPLAVYRRPQTEFSATFIGNSNMLPCTVNAIPDGSAVSLQLANSPLTLRAEVDGVRVEVGQAVWACVRADDIDLVAVEAGESRPTHPNVVTLVVQRAVLTGGIVSVDGNLDGHSLRVNVGGSRRFALLDGTAQTVTCHLGHVTIVPRQG